MQRMIPEKTKVHVELFRGVTIGDLIVGGVALGMLILILASNLPYKIVFTFVIVVIAAVLLVRLDTMPTYQYVAHILSYYGYRHRFVRACTDQDLYHLADAEGAPAGQGTAKKKSSKSSAKAEDMSQIIPFTGIEEDQIVYLNGQYYGAVIEIDPVEFRFFSESRRANAIENCFGRIIRSIQPDYCANIVKLERPIMYDAYLEKEYGTLDQLSRAYEHAIYSEDEMKSRVEIKYDQLNELLHYENDGHIVTPFYYLVLFESDRRRLELQVREAMQFLTSGELTVRRLDNRGLAVFLKYTNQIDFDEHEVTQVRDQDLAQWAMPDDVEMHVRRVDVNGMVTHNFRVVTYPTMVNDSWLASVLSIPATKVVIKFKPMDRSKSIRNIDRSLQELRGQWSATGVDSKRMEIETHINTLQELLFTLQGDNESLLETNIYVTAYDINVTRQLHKEWEDRQTDVPIMTDMKKNIRRSWSEAGFRLNNMEFDQVQAFIGSQVSALDPMGREGRGIPSNTLAACYPWIFAHVSDVGGVKLGESDGIPVFVDFFRRDSERVNSNMVIVGKSGSGKSYATKSLLANLAAEDAKIFILDPENEYTELAHNLHGQMINVGNAQYGRLNPFHIITSLDDDEAGESGSTSGSYETHLQFLEEFFQQIIPDCDKDAMEYLNTLVDHMYLTHNITPETDLSRLRPEDYPIFDDLYDEVLEEFQSSDNPFTRDMLGTLMNYVAKFSTGGRNANIWNGPSTITTDENFTVFNFQSMLANRNQTIANAQMLLVLKYVDNEIIKNRDYNLRYHANRKIVVVIDEAHVFIDQKYPIALDFMFQLAKRIRKYNGMQIVITQNIKDFVGTDDLMRKSAAIINACQYSFIFSLAPNDMQDLVKLYANAGGINESEQEEIVQAPRGRAFTIMSPTSRTSFQINTAPGIIDMFESRDFESHYFTGEKGAENWEDFIGPSREAHDNAVAEKRYNAEQKEIRESYQSKVTLNVFEEEEYDELQRSLFDDNTFNVPAESSGVSLRIAEDEPEEPVKLQEIANDPPVQQQTVDPASMQVFSMIADALGRMADAAEKTGENPIAGIKPVETVQPAAPSTGSVVYASPAESEELREKEEEIERMRREMDERIRALQEENERLRRSEEERQTVHPEEPEEEEEEFEDVPGPFDDQDDDEYPEEIESEEDDDLTALFGVAENDEAYDDFYDEDDDEDEDEEDEDDYDEDEEDEDEEEEDEDDDDDFMSSFCSFAATLMNMSPFEKMRANGREVEEMTLDDLVAEAAAQRDRKRRDRAS